jgi:hypothetical protein
MRTTVTPPTPPLDPLIFLLLILLLLNVLLLFLLLSLPPLFLPGIDISQHESRSSGQWYGDGSGQTTDGSQQSDSSTKSPRYVRSTLPRACPGATVLFCGDHPSEITPLARSSLPWPKFHNSQSRCQCQCQCQCLQAQVGRTQRQDVPPRHEKARRCLAGRADDRFRR